jgi:hypothetical protein
MYYEARYYDPVVGSFVSVDPLFSISSNENELIELHYYAYANLNPIITVDPDGMRTDIFLERQVNPPRSGIVSGSCRVDYANLTLAQGIAVGMAKGLVDMAVKMAKENLRGGVGTFIHERKTREKRRKAFNEKIELYKHFLKDPGIILEISNMPEGEVGRILGESYITTYSLLNSAKALSPMAKMFKRQVFRYKKGSWVPEYQRDLMKLAEQAKKEIEFNKALNKRFDSSVREGWIKIDGTWYSWEGYNPVSFQD